MIVERGFGVYELADEQKKIFISEIERSDKWRMFCKKQMEDTIENVLNDIFGPSYTSIMCYWLFDGWDKSCKIDFFMSWCGESFNEIYNLIEFAFYGKTNTKYKNYVKELKTLSISGDSKNVLVELTLISEQPISGNFKKTIELSYKKILKYIEYRLFLEKGKFYVFENLSMLTALQEWGIDEKGKLTLIF